MNWFGETWGAPCCEVSERVATPTGEICIQCRKPVAAKDQGVVIPHLHSVECVSRRAWHLDCYLGTILPCPGCESCRR